jgi:hypothetical protein
MSAAEAEPVSAASGSPTVSDAARAYTQQYPTE